MKYYLPEWGGSLLLVLIFFIGSLAASVLSVAGMDSLSAVYLVSMIFPLAWGWSRSRKTERSGMGCSVAVNDFHKGDFKCKAVPVILSVCMVPCAAMLLEPVTSLIPMSDILRETFEKMFDASRPVDLVISTVVLAPLCEEMLCRGLICRGMLSRHKPVVAIIWSAFVFALLHGNFTQGAAAFGLGLLMGWVYWKTHSLWCTIAMHCMNNSLSVAMTFIFPDLPVDATYADIMPHNIYIFALVAVAVILAACIYEINRKIDNEETLSFEIRGAACGEEVGR